MKACLSGSSFVLLGGGGIVVLNINLSGCLCNVIIKLISYNAVCGSNSFRLSLAKTDHLLLNLVIH